MAKSKKNSKPMAKKQLKATKGGLLPAVKSSTTQMPTDQISFSPTFQGGVYVAT